MNKLSVYIILFFVWNINSEGINQVRFASIFLEEMYESLPSDSKYQADNVTATYIHKTRTKNIIKSESVIIKYHIEEGIIEDIGISVIDSSLHSLIKSDVICRFIERKMLQLLLIKSDNALVEKLNEDKIDLFLNNYPVLNSMMLVDLYHIMLDRADYMFKKDSLRFELIWSSAKNNSALFSFPATNTLIRAKDKKELDDEIVQRLKYHNHNWSNTKTLELTNESLSEYDSFNNIFYSNGGVFYISEINNNRYFKIRQGNAQYLYEQNYLWESFCNLVQYPLLNYQKNILIKHKVYGYSELYYTIKFSDFIGYFNETCTFYSGLEEIRNDGIKAIVVIHNTTLNFIHLLVIDLNKDELFDPGKSLSANFHTNIPSDNISNLFEDYVPREKHFKLKIK